MATEKWISGSGVGLTWTQIFGSSSANVNSLANNSSVLDSTGDITNGTALDIFADLSVTLASVTSVAPAQINVFIYPLNGDATTYGDGQLAAGTGAAKTPAAQLYVGSIQFPIGTQALEGTLQRIALPPGTFRFVIQSQAGVTLASSGNAVYYRTYNRSVA